MKKNKKNRQIFTDDEVKGLKLEYFSQPQILDFKPQTPFIVPEGYFDSLPEQVMLQIQSLPDFEGVAKVNPFAVPEGYFDSLPTIIQQRIIDRKSRRITIGEWVAQNIFVPKYALAFASVVIVAVFGFNFMTRTISVESSSLPLSASEISNSGYLYEMDESLFVDALADQTPAATNVSDKSAEDYLIDNNIDLTTITEQL